jgi:ribonuclease E
MPKKMLIDATHAEETRVVVVDGNKVEEFDFESENKRQLAGNIYLAKVTRVEPSLQAAFVDYGGNRHGFLAFSEIHPDYYQIPVADREALLEEERVFAESQARRDDDDEKPKQRQRRGRSRSKAARSDNGDAVTTKDVSDDISGMETIDLSDDSDDDEGLSPMETVGETPVEEPTEETSERTQASSDYHQDDGEAQQPSDRDENIEAVSDDDTHEDIRPTRKPRPKRYKIQEVIKVRQILLVQVVKEERGNKGAALTTYLSLAGRYCVLMPNTARGGGISRKITNAPDRKKLKEIATSIDVPQGAGLIIRTAGAKRTKTEIKRDYEYLQRLWEQIRELTLKSIAPAKIYEEGDLIKRSIRDLYNRDIDEVLVEGERGYRIAKDFMKMIMPSHAKNVKNYIDQMPLFARHQVESYLSGMFNPTVQLKSGGYIVIGVTEALVAIDVNSGRATKEGSIEETALKTNLEAAEEVARQLRLRDLAGLIVIDFIDMDERKNNNAVEKRIKDKLKNDRARIQVGRISGFGLMEMSRQRLRPGMIEATTQPCPSCHGTGLIRSDDNMALQVLRQIEEEGVRGRSREVLVRCPVSIANFLMNHKREHVAQIETRYGMSVRIEGDVHLISPDFTMEKFKTATRVVPEATPVVSVDTSLMDQVDEDAAFEDEEEDEVEIEEVEETSDAETDKDSDAVAEDDQKPKKRRRRSRRGGRGRNRNRDRQDDGDSRDENGDDQDTESEAETSDQPVAAEAETETDVTAEADAPEKKTRAPRQRTRGTRKVAEDAPVEAADATNTDAVTTEEAPAPKKTRTRKSPARKPKSDETAEEGAAAADTPAVAETEEAPKKKPRARTRKKVETPEVADAAETAPEKKKKAPAKRTRAKATPKPKADEQVVEPVAETPAPAPEPIAVEPQPVATPEPVAEVPAPVVAEPVAAEPQPEPVGAEAEDDGEAKKKRRGWWSLGR